MKLAPVAWRAILESSGRAQWLTLAFIRGVRRPCRVGRALSFGFHEVPGSHERRIKWARKCRASSSFLIAQCRAPMKNPGDQALCRPTERKKGARRSKGVNPDRGSRVKPFTAMVAVVRRDGNGSWARRVKVRRGSFGVTHDGLGRRGCALRVPRFA